MTTPAQTALSILLDSRDAEQDAPIWHDDGSTVARLARTAGVVVGYAHVELGTVCSVEYRTGDGRKGE